MSDKNQSDSLQGTPSPLPCSNGCGFFGSPSTMNMCSKCYRDCQKTARPSTPAVASPTPTSPTAAEAAAAFSSSVSAPQASSPQPVAPQSLAPPPAAPSPAPSTQQQAPTDLADLPPPRKVQKNTSRCFSCRKKVGLTGFKCHCGYVFCSEHRYSEAHDCDYDYQTSGRKQLAKNNPVVVASKLNKI